MAGWPQNDRHGGVNRPRIFFVIDDPVFGGAERLIATICQHCRAMGWRVAVLTAAFDTQPGGALGTWFSASADTIVSLPVSDRAGRLEVLTGPDVAAICYSHFPAAAFLALDVAGIRRDIRQTMFIFNELDANAVNLIAPALDLVIAESLDVVAHLAGTGQASTGARFIPSCIPPLPMRPPRRGAAGPLHVGFIGRLTPGKNPLSVISIAMRLPPDAFRFTIVGGGMLGTKVARRVWLASHFRNIRFLGHVPDDELEHIWEGLDVIVLPSDSEGRPLVLQEARWRGVAVVASRVGGIAEIITHDETGLLCTPGSAREFAEQLLRLAKEPDLLDQIVVAARARAEEDEDSQSRLARYAASITGSEA